MNLGTEDFVYKLPGTTAGGRPGAHRSHSRGAGMSFAAHARLFDQPDPRRLDLRASLSDIRGDWLVRTYLQRSSVSIKALVDVSASMHFGTPGKLHEAAHFLSALGYSAHGYGDSVSLLAFDRKFREDIYMPARMGRGIGITMASTISQCANEPGVGGNVQALADCAEHIAGTTGLVFLVSDFHWPLDGLDKVLDKLAAAMVVPIVIWDNAEIEPPQPGQLFSLRDSESGQHRRIWLRKKTHAQWLENVQSRRTELNAAFGKHDVFPFYVNGQFNAANLSRYFMEKVA